MRYSKERGKVMERVEYSKECGKEVIKRVGCSKGRGDSNDGRVSQSDYLEILVFK